MIQETYYLKPALIETVDIINGGFESWSNWQPEGWQINGKSQVSQNVFNIHSGDYSCNVYQYGQLWQECDVTPGETYTLTVYKCSQGSFQTDGIVEVYNVTDSGKNVNASRILTSYGSWQQFDLSFKVPDNVKRIEIRFKGAAGGMIIDDVSCVLAK